MMRDRIWHVKNKECDLLVGSRKRAVQLLFQHTSCLPTKEMALTLRSMQPSCAELEDHWLLPKGTTPMPPFLALYSVELLFTCELPQSTLGVPSRLEFAVYSDFQGTFILAYLCWSVWARSPSARLERDHWDNRNRE